MQDWKMTEKSIELENAGLENPKMQDKSAGLENAGLENEGQKVPGLKRTDKLRPM